MAKNPLRQYTILAVSAGFLRALQHTSRYYLERDTSRQEGGMNNNKILMLLQKNRPWQGICEGSRWPGFTYAGLRAWSGYAGYRQTPENLASTNWSRTTMLLFRRQKREEFLLLIMARQKLESNEGTSPELRYKMGFSPRF